MKRTIIVVNDFSETAHNALDYACGLAADAGAHLLMLHIYTLPTSYSSDAVALSLLKDDYDDAQDTYGHDLERWQQRYPELPLTGKMVTGGLIECLRDQLDETNAELVVMGAPKNYDELWTWDNELLNSLTSFSVPVLMIPLHMKYKAIANIGFACDYQTLLVPRQVNFIKLLLNTTHAKLHVVHVATKAPENTHMATENEAMINELLKGVTPDYHTLESKEVIDSISRFVLDNNLDFLIVIPHRHGVWYNIFHQSHTKQLAQLNHIPVLAMQD